MHETFTSPDELYEVRCLPTPEVRMDADGVWQMERFAWFAVYVGRDCWVAYAYTPTPSPQHGIAAFERTIDARTAAIGFVGVDLVGDLRGADNGRTAAAPVHAGDDARSR
jgi:hypothetical protein